MDLNMMKENLSMPWLGARIQLANWSLPGGVQMRQPNANTLVAFPEEEIARRDTLLVYVHGGGWVHGSPRQYRFVACEFASRGYPAAVLGYRLVPEARYPGQVEDVFAGYLAALDACAQEGIVIRRVVLIGQSAGSPLVTWLALDKARQQQMGVDPSLFAGLVNISGPLSLMTALTVPAMRLMVADFLGLEAAQLDANPPALGEADPLRLLDDRHDLPMLCLHGEADPIVPPACSEEFVQMAQGCGSPAELLILPGKLHSELVKIFLDSEHPGAQHLWQFIEMATRA